MKNTDFSFYVPVFNGENTIEKCIKSILNQSLKPNNILIVNDCSNDNTENILQKTILNETFFSCSFFNNISHLSF